MVVQELKYDELKLHVMKWTCATDHQVGNHEFVTSINGVTMNFAMIT